MKNYITVRGTSETDLWHSVNGLLERGYQLEGGVCVVYAWGGLVYFQAMSKEQR